MDGLMDGWMDGWMNVSYMNLYDTHLGWGCGRGLGGPGPVGPGAGGVENFDWGRWGGSPQGGGDFTRTLYMNTLMDKNNNQPLWGWMACGMQLSECCSSLSYFVLGVLQVY